MIRAIFITCAICLTSICFAGSGAEVHMQKMLDKYESLSSYEDSGSSITKFTHIEGNSFSEELRFKTVYEENETLYFEWLEMPSEFEKQLRMPPGYKDQDLSKPKRNTILKNKNGIKVKYFFKEKEETINSLRKALSGATGVSSGLAWMVPRYLSPELPCRPDFNAKNIIILSETSDIVSIELTFDSGDFEIFHIDKNTYLLNKYEENSKLNDGTSVYQVVEYSVVSYK
ncbi:MAG: hypothetical protein ABW080_17870 [Candidatus Thiodiazotropha sp.]